MNFVNEVKIMIKKKRKDDFIRQTKETYNEYIGLGYRKKNKEDGKKQTYFKTLVD